MSSSPMVSVFMPAYNQEHLIAEAIESVINQSYTDWELVIGDDCSTDNTYEVARQYQQRFPQKIVLFRNEVNLGITGNCNEVLKRCRGKYIAFHAGDDVWLPRKLDMQIDIMEEDSSCLMSYHNLEVFESESNQVLYYWNSGKKRPKAIEGDSYYVLGKLIEHTAGFFGALSVVIRRSALPVYARYDERLPHLSELSLWVVLLSNSTGRVIYIPEVLARYRKHNGGITQKNHQVECDFFLAIIENEYPKLITPVRKARCARYYRKGVLLLTGNKPIESKEVFLISLRNGFFSIKILYWIMRTWVGIGKP